MEENFLLDRIVDKMTLDSLSMYTGIKSSSNRDFSIKTYTLAIIYYLWTLSFLLVCARVGQNFLSFRRVYSAIQTNVI